MAKPGKLLALASLAIVSACTVQPLYGPSSTGSGLLPLNVPLEAPDNRDEQLLRNALVERIGVAPASSVYEGRLDARVSSSGVFNTNSSDALTGISNRRVEMIASLSLVDIETQDVTAKFEATGRTFYERSGQQFANDRAVADATRRAANEAAAALAAQLQVYLKNNPAPSSVK